MYRRFSQGNQVSKLKWEKLERLIQNQLLSNALGIISSWESTRRRKGESQMERNSVAKPRVLTEIAIFFSPSGLWWGPQEPGGIKVWQNQGHGRELTMPLLSFRVHDGIYPFVQLIFIYLALFWKLGIKQWKKEIKNPCPHEIDLLEKGRQK